MLEVQTTTYPIADYLAMLDREEISINKEYQRSNRIWSVPARSFLIETVLKNYPIPKLSLHHRTDLQTLTPHREVVDGQQRTYALRDFMNNEFKLSSRIDTEEWKGKKFKDLPDEDRRQFLNYGLSFDLLIGAEGEEVREVFRRMNTFTVSLNYEEQRNAEFNGKFKWFIRDLTSVYTDRFQSAGVFNDRGFIRMADAKLLTEICHAYFFGIITTNSRSLSQVYRKFDKEFEAEKELGKRLTKALDFVLSFEDLHGGPLLSKAYQFYALVLATLHVQKRVDAIQDQLDVPSGSKMKKRAIVEDNLLTLEGVLLEDEDEDEIDESYEDFVEASETRTNVKEQRIIRTQWFCDALTSQFE